LIADDERHIVRVLELTLSREGYDVIDAHDGLSAWQAAQDHQPDLILADLAMPGMTGCELACKVYGTESMRETPVLLVTAKPLLFPEDMPDQCNIAGMIPKPFSPRQLVAKVIELIGPAKQTNKAIAS